MIFLKSRSKSYTRCEFLLIIAPVSSFLYNHIKYSCKYIVRCSNSHQWLFNCSNTLHLCHTCTIAELWKSLLSDNFNCFFSFQIEARVVLAKLIQHFSFDWVPGQSIGVIEELTTKPKDGCKCYVKLVSWMNREQNSWINVDKQNARHILLRYAFIYHTLDKWMGHEIYGTLLSYNSLCFETIELYLLYINLCYQHRKF